MRVLPAWGAHADRREPASESAVQVTSARASNTHAANRMGTTEETVALAARSAGTKNERWDRND